MRIAVIHRRRWMVDTGRGPGGGRHARHVRPSSGETANAVEAIGLRMRNWDCNESPYDAVVTMKDYR